MFDKNISLGTYELKIEYVTSGSTFAGILTKPIGGEILHDKERKIIGERPILYLVLEQQWCEGSLITHSLVV